ncbi:MAG: response regulator [Lachnospiraceae bacterium]|nr:response regulator [Lachnospiraceae bacterium]
MNISEIRVLIGDDSILARKQMKDILEEVGVKNIEEAANGQEVVEKFRSFKPDIVFLDIVMPVKDGTVAISDICAEFPDAEIIVISSVGTQSYLKQAILNGAKDFVQKPISSSKIEEILLSRFERS